MNTYRMNAVMTGILYFLGTVFGILGALIGGEVFISLMSSKPLAGVDMLGLVAANSSQLAGGALFTLMMGTSLAAMTVSLYPIIRKDSEELAMGMVLFRGALEGTWYFVTSLGFFALVALGNEYIQKECSNDRRPLLPGDGLWVFGFSHWRRSAFLANRRQTACRCGYSEPCCRQFVPAYRGCIFLPHDGYFAGGDDGFPLPAL